MIEAKKCLRCGCMYIADTEVCNKCQKKDGADLYRLKGFLENGTCELAIATGITNKNLTRFLGYEEFKGVCAEQNIIAASGKIQEESITELV